MLVIFQHVYSCSPHMKKMWFILRVWLKNFNSELRLGVIIIQQMIQQQHTEFYKNNSHQTEIDPRT